MKKILLIFSTLFLFALIPKAQQAQFGLKAGINSSGLNVEGAQDLDSKIGFHGGGLAHIHVSDHFAVQPELVFSMQGGESGDTKLKLNYLNLPVLAQYMFDGGFRLQTGPQLGFLLSAKYEVGDLEVEVDEAYKSLDFSWSFGAGYLFPQGLGIDARYNLGISDIVEDNSIENRNSVFQVGLFYQFGSSGTVRK